MCQWHRNIQRMIDEIDACIRREDDEASTLSSLAGKLGYSESYVSSEIQGAFRHAAEGIPVRS